jgi:hypothetical protein
MSTAAQVTANQLNAQLSTGPRSEESKARVAGNAIRHGLTAKHLVIRADEQEQFAALQESLSAELNPQGAVEAIVFQEIVHAAWNLSRFRRIEVESSSDTASDFSDPNTSTVLDRLGRYQARAQRACYKAIRELRTLETNRALRARKLDVATAASVPAIADINELTKQTQSEVTAEALELALTMVDYEAKTLQANAIRSRTGAPASSRPSPAAAALRL